MASAALGGRSLSQHSQLGRSANNSDDLDAIDFHALVALTRGVTDALVGFHCLHARTAQRAGMQIDVAGAGIGHHEAKTLLIVEELDLAFDHRARRAAVAMAVTAAAITAAAAIAAAISAIAIAAATEAAAITARAARRRF